MSLQSFVQTVETDIGKVWHTVEVGAEDVFGTIWAAAKPLFLAFEPTAVANAFTGITTFLSRAATDIADGETSDILQGFLEFIQTEEGQAFADAKTLSEDLLSVLIGLAKAKAA